ncbi:MAG: M20/M25/M40 family metallo-hydrolase [Thermomicrobiales bacterium]|nr:M20/M25/M40 family metallo-hydrolase [Thermomicrobiales bacterium]
MPAAGTPIRFEGVVSEDGARLYGRGANDMKTSVGVMMTMLNMFKDADLKGALSAHIVSDEEIGAEFGTRHVLAEIEAGNLPRPDYVFIGEGASTRSGNAERGGLAVIVVHFKGRQPYRGRTRHRHQRFAEGRQGHHRSGASYRYVPPGGWLSGIEREYDRGWRRA